MLDVVIRGGMVLDGTAAPAFRADVGLSGGQVTAVGPLDDARGATEVDATGRYVFPGFIDTHVHADATVFDPRMQQAALRQGVTRLPEAARQAGLDPAAFCRELLVATRLEAGCVFAHRAAPASGEAADPELALPHPEAVA